MIKRRPRAIYAIIDCAEYIGRRSLSAAERFFDATDATFEQLELMPGMGTSVRVGRLATRQYTRMAGEGFSQIPDLLPPDRRGHRSPPRHSRGTRHRGS